MERVIRVCEITGRKTVIAEGLTSEQAIALIRATAPTDEYARYIRITMA